MDEPTVDTIKKIIVKRLLGEFDEADNRILTEWMERSENNRALFEHLSGMEFIGRAITDDHTGTKREVWRCIRRNTLGRRRLVVYRRLSRIAAVLIILAGCFYLFPEKDTENSDMFALQREISPGRSKAVVEFPNGDTVILGNDTTLQLSRDGILMVDRQGALDIMPDARTRESSTTYQVIRVPRGGEYTVKLSDRTVVYMNAESELRLPSVFAKNSRDVYFSGEGYFVVEKDSVRPFVVHTERGDIAVLGTEFGLRSYCSEEETVTTLIEGRVKINRDSNYYYLMPNEQARVDRRGKMSVQQVNVHQYVAWVKGRMVFENETLENIMNELSRWYDFSVSFRKPELKALRFTIDVAKYGELQEFTSLMEKMDKVVFWMEGKRVIVE